MRQFTLLKQILDSLAPLDLNPTCRDWYDYLHALSLVREGDLTAGGSLMARLAERSTVRARAFYSLGGFSLIEGNVPTACRFYHESKKNISGNPLMGLSITRMEAVAVGSSGDHTRAINLIESILPFAKYLDSVEYADLLNTYSYELGCNNRLIEAFPLSHRLCALFNRDARPEYFETLAELEQMRGKGLKPKTVNVVDFDERKIGLIKKREKKERIFIRESLLDQITSNLVVGQGIPLSQLKIACEIMTGQFTISDCARMQHLISKIKKKKSA